MDGKALRHRLAEADLLATQLAEASGLSRSFLSDLLHERTPISREMGARLEAALQALAGTPRRRALRGAWGAAERAKLEEAVG